MKILQITPGSGDSFYCENCLRDQDLVRALRAGGHDAMMVPLYLPPNADALTPPPASGIFFGGLNVYLQQKSALFRHAPRWLDRLLDARWLLRLAGRLSGMTSAKDLAATTMSLLRGEDGRQKKELRRLVDFLASRGQVDVVCLSNALLAGLARAIKAQLGAAVVCMLQDEDEFLDDLAEGDREAAWQAMADRCRDIDAFVAVSRYYADFMKPRLGLTDDRLHVVYAGVDAEKYAHGSSAEQAGQTAAAGAAPAIGFLSRMSHRKGLDLLVEAFVRLKADARFSRVVLRVAGGKTAADDAFLRGVRETLDRAGLASSVEFLPNLGFFDRADFLRGLSVFSVPQRVGEASGRYIMESLACGVPAVQPANGVSEELLAATGGGLLCRPNDAAALADSLAELLADPSRARKLGQAGQAAVREKFTARRSADGLLAVFENATKTS